MWEAHELQTLFPAVAQYALLGGLAVAVATAVFILGRNAILSAGQVDVLDMELGEAISPGYLESAERTGHERWLSDYGDDEDEDE